MALSKQGTQPNSPIPDELEDVLEQATPRQTSRTTLVLWLVAASLLMFFIPLYLFSASVNRDVKGMSTNLGVIQTSLTRVPTPAPAIQQLLTPLAQVQGQTNQISAVYPTIAAPRPDWPAVMTVIGNYDPSQITLTSITRTVNTLTLAGRANNDTDVTNYAHSLEQSNLFSRVLVQSIHAVMITPTATLNRARAPASSNSSVVQPPPPANTPAPVKVNPPLVVYAATSVPVAQPTATPNLGDAYEPDDSQPKPIALGQAQTHSFYPEGDVDAVSFLAKSGHYYHVYTTNLAPGVDTYISVRIGGIVQNNDDAVPGSLYSDVVIQNTGSDTTGIVAIANRGMYGPDKTYQIVIAEVAATPTPAPTNTPPQPPMPSPTATATATPGLGDAYEPDNTADTAKPIYIGATQSHTFSPNGDIDNISFPVKQDHFYQVLTSNPALGVDTVVSVKVDDQLWVNDDYTFGSGNFASSVCFSVSADDTAIATITNKTGYYGPDKSYTIKVSEVPTLTAPSCVPITPVPAAALPPAKSVPGLAAPMRLGSVPFERANDRSIIAPTLEFVIVVEVKVTPP